MSICVCFPWQVKNAWRQAGRLYFIINITIFSGVCDCCSQISVFINQHVFRAYCIKTSFLCMLAMLCVYWLWSACLENDRHMRVTAEKTFTFCQRMCLCICFCVRGNNGWGFLLFHWFSFSIKSFYFESFWFRFETSLATRSVLLCSDFCAKGTLCPSGTTEQKHVIMVDSCHSSQPNNIVITSSYRGTSKPAVNQSTEK